MIPEATGDQSKATSGEGNGPRLTLINAYTLLGVYVDRIGINSEVRNKFLTKLPKEVRDFSELDKIIWQLVQLRKARKLPTHHSEN